MNILIIASQNIGNTEYKESMEHIVNAAQQSGHKIFAEHVFESEIRDPLQFAHEMNDKRKQSDVLIAEVSIHSAGVEHDIQLALTGKKPALILYNKKGEKQALYTTKGIQNRLATIESYTTPSEAQHIVKKFISSAKIKLDTKFILIIPPEIDQYLQWASDCKRMYKAQIVRNALEVYMGKDQIWQEFLQEEA